MAFRSARSPMVLGLLASTLVLASCGGDEDALRPITLDEAVELANGVHPLVADVTSIDPGLRAHAIVVPEGPAITPTETWFLAADDATWLDVVVSPGGHTDLAANDRIGDGRPIEIFDPLESTLLAEFEAGDWAVTLRGSVEGAAEIRALADQLEIVDGELAQAPDGWELFGSRGRLSGLYAVSFVLPEFAPGGDRVTDTDIGDDVPSLTLYSYAATGDPASEWRRDGYAELDLAVDGDVFEVLPGPFLRSVRHATDGMVAHISGRFDDDQLTQIVASLRVATDGDLQLYQDPALEPAT